MRPSEQCQACSMYTCKLEGWKGHTGPGAGTQVQGPSTSLTAGSTEATGDSYYHY